jgi:hypothetical protein
MTRHPTPWALLIVAALSLPFSGCGDNPNTALSSDIASSAPVATSSRLETSSSDPGSSVPPPHLVEGSEFSLEPGTYQFSVFANFGVETPDALVQVPSGFDDDGTDWFVVSSDRQEFLGLWTAGLVDRDACPSSRVNDLFDPGPSVQDMADALVAQKSTRASTPKPVTLAGYEGLYVELSSPHDISRCGETGNLWANPGGRGIGNGQVDLVWILDVDGQRLLVNAAYTPKSSAKDIDKLTSMVESLKFTGNAE